MKNAFFLLSMLALTIAYAEEECPPISEEQILIEAAVEQNNNKCPNRNYVDQFSTITNLADLQKAANEKLQALGIKIEWQAGSNDYAKWDAFQDSPDDILRAKRQLNIAIHALSLYPSGALKKSGMETIKFVKDLRAKDVEGNYTTRSASPFPQYKMMIYADNDDIGCLAGIEMRMHHELFHLLEGTVLKSMSLNPKEWNDLNPKDFSYGKGGYAAYGVEGFKNLQHPRKGFATEYSYFGPEEDRSDIFGLMMTEGYSTRIKGWASIDPELKKKMEYIKKFMERKISKDMNEDYFKSIP